jgi:CRISPR-associated endonuclease/helicase Cas3
MNFESFFRRATRIASEPDGRRPYPYQIAFAEETDLPDLLNVPTGVGKTATANLGWLYRRQCDASLRAKTPRRLVYCLPMRVLVEQTRDNAVAWLKQLGLFASEPGDTSPVEDWALGQHRIAVSVLMGGAERDELRDWALWPERDAILIGTQDMLLSRALNRGYAAGRARWPMEFALLNNDCLWVFDEVQLMSTGLATSLQLDAWRKSLRLRGEDGFRKTFEGTVARPCHSLWMSATLAKHWLVTAVDWKPRVTAAWQRKEEDDRAFAKRIVDRTDR